MIASDDPYFSELEIKARDPILYEIYLGERWKKQKPEEDVKVKEKEAYNNYMKDSQVDNKKMPNVALSEFLLTTLDKEVYSERLDSAIKDAEGLEGKKIFSENMNVLKELDTSKNDPVDEIDELVRIMHIKFLTGLDKDFVNYEAIDNNEEFDDKKELNRDQEERFFEEEEEATYTNKPSEYTGVQDY